MKLDQRKDYSHFTAFDRFQIDGLHRPMKPRPRPYPWLETAGWTIGTAALVWLLLRIGGL